MRPTLLLTSRLPANNDLGMGHIQAFGGLTVVYKANQSTFATLQFSGRDQSAEVLHSCPPISQLNQSNVDGAVMDMNVSSSAGVDVNFYTRNSAQNNLNPHMRIKPPI